MYPLYGAIPEPYEPVGVTRTAVLHIGLLMRPFRCISSQYHRAFIPLSVSLWNDHADPVFGGVGLACIKSRANAFLFAKLLDHF